MADAPLLQRLTVPSPFGPLTLTADADALTALDWGTSGHGTVSSVAGSLQGARDGVLARAADQLAAYFAGTRRTFDLPLAPRGTPFQRRVWRRMAEIPYGEVMTYGALAAAVGSAARAVGGACGRNPVPIILPCHRVVGGAGALTGYSGAGGLDTKRFLLDLEGGRPPALAFPPSDISA